MTRINVGIPVCNLTDEHLLAEHREIKRLANQKLVSNPTKTLVRGKGHVLFFKDKQLFCLNRYNQLYNECIKRGFKVENYSNSWNKVEKVLMNDYTPTLNDIKLMTSWLTDKILKSNKKFWHFNHKQINKEQAIINLYKQNNEKE